MNDETFCPPENFTTPPEGWTLKRHVTAPRTYYYTNTAQSHRISWSTYKELWAVKYNFHNYYFLTLEEAFEAVHEGLEEFNL
jgi:hypothetical protein